jgi:hypothetical protein
MRNLKMFIIAAALTLLSCKDGDKYDGLILTDENTGKKYLLKNNAGDSYFIDERVMVISGQDTTYQFK